MNEIFDINGLSLYVNENHRFGTDAVLLSRFIKPMRKHIVCDLCSGCGIIPFLLYNSENRPTKIYSLDIAPEANELINKSVEKNNLGDYIFPILEDLKSIIKIPQESVDIVSVNPPYFKSRSGLERKSADQANARHELLCDIDDVTTAAARLLKFGGQLKMCHIPDRLPDVILAMRRVNIEPKRIVFISAKVSEKSKPWLFLISGKKGAKPGLIIEHTFTEALLGEE